MGRSPRPGPQELRLLDPDGDFRRRLEVDREAIGRLLEAGEAAALPPIIHRLAGAAGTFGYAEIGEIALTLDDAAIAGLPMEPDGVRRLLAALSRAAEKSA